MSEVFGLMDGNVSAAGHVLNYLLVSSCREVFRVFSVSM